MNNAGESEGLCHPASASQSEIEPFALLTENIQQITTNGLSRDIATSGRVFSTMEKRNMALIGCWKSPPACLVHLVCSVCLVCLVYSVEQDQLDEPDRPERPDEPDKPQTKRTAFLSILRRFSSQHHAESATLFSVYTEFFRSLLRYGSYVLPPGRGENYREGRGG